MARNGSYKRPCLVVLLIIAVLSAIWPPKALAQIPPPSTSDEADLVVLVGDIDNFGFGSPAGFDVFSGKSTPVHSFPFKPGLNDPPGTDRIMVGSSYVGRPPAGSDGYTSTTSRPDNLPKPIDVQYSLGAIAVRSATLQMFVDDFQAPVFTSRFQVTLNGQRAPFLENVLNVLNQTGPVGKLITVPIPADFLPQVISGRLSIYIDDPTTGAGDGFAIDFLRLLINPRPPKQVGTVSGKVTDAATGQPLAGVAVSAAGATSAQTGADGLYTLPGTPAGLAVITASKNGYTSLTLSADLVSGASTSLNFALRAAPAPSPSTTATPPTGTPGPVAYYPFDGDARDYSGNGNHGTNSGGVFVPGRKGQALKLDGVNNYVSAPVNINPDVMPQMTMTAWVQASKATGTIISHDDGGFDRTINIDDRGGGSGWSAFSGSGAVLGYRPVTIGDWVFIAAVYDQGAKKVTLYVNDSVYEKAGTVGSGWKYINIGRNPSFGGYFPGVIDEVRIYNYSLSANEIASLRSEAGPIPVPGVTPSGSAGPGGLVGYWKFDETSGNIAADSSGLGNNGTVKGIASWTPNGRTGGALTFDGKSNYVVTPVLFSQLANGMTWMAWAKHDAPNMTWSWVFSEDSPVDNHTQMGKMAGSTEVVWGPQGVGSVQTKGMNVADGQWHHIAGVWEKGVGLRLYIDGVLKASGSFTGAMTAKRAIRIGAKNDDFPAEKWKGAIDEARIYNRALSADEIRDAMSGTGPGPSTTPTPTPTPQATPTPPARSVDTTLIADERVASQNGTVALPVRLEKASRLGSLNFSLRYDPAVVKVNRVDGGDLVGGSLFQSNTRDAGIVRFGIATTGAEGINGDGPVAYVVFTATGARGSTSSITLGDLQATDSAGGRVSLNLLNGRITIGAKVKGDYDGDGRLTAKDALAALKMSVKDLPEDLNLDMDSDGKVSAEDARRILTGALSGAATTSSTPPTATTPPSAGVTGTIVTGPPVLVASTRVGTGGGTVTVTQQGNPITGLELTVPANSYTDSRQFQISYAPVERQTFGAQFNPISPMIIVDNGGGYSEELMKVKVPLKVTPGQFATAFLYDAKTTRLEGLPLAAQDANSITIATRHFSKFVVVSFGQDLLQAMIGNIESGFKPGINDWQFTNYGSYIAPGGHCSGQSLAALWYYATEPGGKGAFLYGRYDNNGNKPATPGFWQDDSLGYRFASVVQADSQWDSWSRKITMDLAYLPDSVTWRLFAAAMFTTHEPQMVEVWDTKGGGGHAMIVYRMDGGNLYVADPNYPGKTDRVIKYNTFDGKFAPYSSGSNAADIEAGKGVQYDRIVYIGQQATLDWSKLTARWAELKDKTIGNDRFPGNAIWYKDKDGMHELKDGYVSPDKLINIQVRSDETEVGWITYRDQVKLIRDAGNNYELNPGNNLVGIEIWGKKVDRDKDGKIIESWHYVDFKYYNVVYNAPATPPPPTGPVVYKLQGPPAARSDTQPTARGVSFIMGKELYIYSDTDPALGLVTRSISLGDLPQEIRPGQGYAVSLKSMVSVEKAVKVVRDPFFGGGETYADISNRYDLLIRAITGFQTLAPQKGGRPVPVFQYSPDGGKTWSPAASTSEALKKYSDMGSTQQIVSVGGEWSDHIARYTPPSPAKPLPLTTPARESKVPFRLRPDFDGEWPDKLEISIWVQAVPLRPMPGTEASGVVTLTYARQ